MASLAMTPYSYIQGELIKVRASAMNEFDSSEVSAANGDGATLRTAPHKMTNVLTHSDTRKDLLRVEWLAPTTEQSGDSNILSYKLVWDAGTGTVDQELTSVTTYFTDLTYTITDGI